MYNEEFVNLQIDSISPREGIALDIGANHGMHTRKIAEKFTKVYAFEPHPQNIEVLKQQTAKHPNIEIVPAAITPTSGPVKLYNCPNPGGHTISEGVMGHRIWGHTPDSYHEVQGMTLDEFCKDKQISFMKVDIEGAENTAFLGAIETLKNNKMDIVIEVHRFVDCDSLFKFFTELDYIVYDIDGIGRPSTFTADHHYIVTNRFQDAKSSTEAQTETPVPASAA
jgi:FkbM family methyltransferase